MNRPETPPVPPCGRQLRLPLFPEGVTHVSDAVSISKQNGSVWYFHQGQPIGVHLEGDVASFRMYTSMLCDSGACKLAEVERAFGVSAISVKRALKQYRASGARGFFDRRRGVRSDPVMTPERLVEIQGFLDQGFTDRQVAEHLGLKRDTIYRAVKSGRLHRPTQKGGSPVQQG